MGAKGKKALFALVLLCCAAFAVYRCLSSRHIDREPPQITMEQDELSLSVGDPKERLLEGVRAQDAQDGDVTDSIVVESVRGLVSDKRFTVTYAAFDAAGNVSKAQRTVFYKDYTAPRFALSAPLIFREGTSLDVFAPLEAEDVFDGSLKDRIKGTLVSGETQIAQAGEYTVEFRVTNSLGDTAYLTAPVEVLPAGDGGAEVTLSSYLTYLKKNAAFVPEYYVTGLSAGGQIISLDEASVQITSNVDMTRAGTYWVDYAARYGQKTARTRLLVVVED